MADGTFTRVETYLEDYGPLIPTAVYSVLARMIATQLRNRGQNDAANYLERAAATLEA